VNVDAIVFWLVWNAEKSILEVRGLHQAIMLSAQTALRESMGRQRTAPDGRSGNYSPRTRQNPGREDQSWGITVQSVEIRDVQIPPGPAGRQVRQAQAETRATTRIILGQAEKEIAESFNQASLIYQNNHTACICAP